MTTTLLQSTFALPSIDTAWEQTQRFQNNGDRWTAYLNQLALSVVVPLLTEELAPDRIRTRLNPSAQASQWSCVTGTPIQVGNAHWLILPTEQIDEDSISVPQEWLEIPDWAVQQVVAVEVNPDDATVRMIGYASTTTIKSKGVYQSSDRTYVLDRSHWIDDLATLAVIESLQPALQQQDHLMIPTLPVLSIEQAQNLITRLGHTTQPRLEIPFQTWAALIQHSGWRQQFHQLRQTGEQPRSVLQWLRSGVDAFSTQLGWQSIALQTIGARDTTARTQMALVRPVTIDQQPYELRVKAIDLDAAERIWRFELQSTVVGGFVPSGVMLRLLTEDLQGFEGNEVSATTPVEMLSIDVVLEAGEALVWEIEPTPEDGDREILCF